ncbi:hypothetical protein BKP35_04825 [Anaerobacillus arseniciselenatis]|uniref:DUF3887 domain-containing protein n=1 Tax=Anaerobacillus arseniciselenatis TaxID=85682 RepID=A0A1S2LU30_9BACI|nr:DUF3887 domain-containing protein [Anaerobacillus arseniciselenatis]OIJ15177.1 hypothetical protein BKP35_04825 [Anaerobacillus arseniciselenatis]
MLIVISLMFLSLLVLGCSTGSEESNLEEVSGDVIERIVQGDYEIVYQQIFTEDLKDSLPFNDFKQMWQVRVDSSGEYIGMGSLEVSQRGETYYVAKTELEYTNLIFPVRMIFNGDNQLVSIHLGEALVNYNIPETVIEEEVVVGKGTAYELGGTLTLPKQFEEPLPAVVLVHGSVTS